MPAQDLGTDRGGGVWHGQEGRVELASWSERGGRQDAPTRRHGEGSDTLSAGSRRQWPVQLSPEHCPSVWGGHSRETGKTSFRSVILI